MGARRRPPDRRQEQTYEQIHWDHRRLRHCRAGQQERTLTAAPRLDGDGANGQFGQPPCYAPASFTGKTLDVLANAGRPGNWFGVVTDTAEQDGHARRPGSTGPLSGSLVSATSLPGQDGERLPASSPVKYVDSATVPFVVMPPMIPGTAATVNGVTYPLQRS
jgi:hypothetical protein